MAITFQSVLNYTVATAAGGVITSGSFSPNAAGDTLCLFINNAASNANPSSITGSSTYSVDTTSINPAIAVAHTLACAAGSQTYTSNVTTGSTERIFTVDYSGVGGITSYNTNSPNNPGTGSGAITGTSVMVATGSVLVACCFNYNTGTNTITSPSGTVRGNGLTSDNWEYCITEYAGAGSNIQPSFTSADGATERFMIAQIVLAPTVVVVPVAASGPMPRQIYIMP